MQRCSISTKLKNNIFVFHPALCDKLQPICNPTRNYREPDSGGGLQTSRLLADEGSVNPPGGTHLLKEQVTIGCIRLGGAFILFPRRQSEVQKLFNADLLDIFPIERGFVYACKETLANGNQAVAFYHYNQEVDIFEKIPVLTYINYKFGATQFDVARTLGNFVTCDVVPITASTKIVSYADGTIKVLGSAGEIVSEDKVEYLDNPACSPAVNGADIWFVVPESNAIINYSIKHSRIEFRIGSAKDKTFCHPSNISVYDNKLFICNTNSYKIRTIDLTNYTVADYQLFNEPIYKYFRVKGTEYAVLKSGIYSL